MQKPIAVLFDIDGTLLSTGGAGARSWRWAFNELYGIPADIGQFSEAGMTDPEVARRTFVSVIGRSPTGRELATLLAKYLSRLPHEVTTSVGYKVLDGVTDLLPQLCGDGILLGITTGAIEAAAQIKLARGALNHYFCFGGYGSDSAVRAELTRCAIERAGRILDGPVDPSHVIVVGDTPSDVEAAHAAGAVALGVATGHFSRGDLQKAGADHLLDSLAEPMPF